MEVIVSKALPTSVLGRIGLDDAAVQLVLPKIFLKQQKNCYLAKFLICPREYL
jgi:hypothetical protein